MRHMRLQQSCLLVVLQEISASQRHHNESLLIQPQVQMIALQQIHLPTTLQSLKRRW